MGKKLLIGLIGIVAALGVAWLAKNGVKPLMSISERRACQVEIQNRARYRARWVDGLFDLKFPREEPAAIGTIFAGDAVEFQNGFGAWQNQQYYCTVNPTTHYVVAVDVSPGKMLTVDQILRDDIRR